MKETFNREVWEKLVRSKRAGDKITAKIITQLFGVSNRIATAYLFALNNQEEIIRDADKMVEVHKLETKLHQKEQKLRIVLKELEESEARNNFAFAIQEGIKSADKVVITKANEKSYNEEITSISLLSDIHYEETIEKAVMNYINEYNTTIATERVTNYFTRLLWMINSLRNGGFNIRNHVLAILGDLINGYIHEELEESNGLSPIEATIAIEQLLISGIEFLVEEGNFDKLYLIMTRGNHGRTTGRKRYSTGYKNSYEYLIYHNIRRHFVEKYPEKVISLLPDSEFAYIKVYDKMLCFSHGDHFNYRGGIGGIMIPFKGFIYKHNQIVNVDKYFIGHWHTSINLNDGMINGSVVGYSPYAMGKSFAPEMPQQWLQLLDSKRGFTIATPIILTDW